MMTLSPHDLAEFFRARSRAGMSAEQVLKDLESRGIANAGTARMNTPRALCDSAAQKIGRKLSALTAHELAAIL